MIDLLLLAGVALCAISVVMAIVSVARTQAPRGAAVALVLGIVVLFAASWLDQRPFGIANVGESWNRLISGQSFGTDTVTAPPPAVTESAPVESAPAPAPAPAETPAEAAAESPAAEAPAEAPAAPDAAPDGTTDPAPAAPAQPGQ